ncbi:MAG: hypothetical protein O3B82_03205, partial [Bacteroidetes bacterium]|nr:hypothetical protein [Bacteroidota bacterium]
MNNCINIVLQNFVYYVIKQTNLFSMKKALFFSTIFWTILFAKAQLPSITSFSPMKGPVGTT